MENLEIYGLYKEPTIIKYVRGQKRKSGGRITRYGIDTDLRKAYDLICEGRNEGGETKIQLE